MQVEALKIFCDVARFRSFSRGAVENEVTQSTASQTVHHLEEHLGVTLIERSQRPLRLTPEGQTFYDGCRDIIHRYFSLEQAVRSISQDANATVRVAAIYSVGLGDMSQIAHRFSEQFAPAQVQVDYQPPDRVYASVVEEKVDLGIVSFPRAQRELTVIPWRKEPMVLVCHPKHPLARRARVSAAALTGENLVAFDENLVIRRETDRFLKKHGATVRVTLAFDNVEAIKRAVEVTSGVAILPLPTLHREIKSRTLVAIPFQETDFVRPLGIIHRRGKPLYASAQHFIGLLQNSAPGNGSNGHH